MLLSILPGPVEMFMQEFKSSFATHGMPSVEVFYFGLVTKAELIVKIPYFPEFVGDPIALLYKVIVAALNHKGSWKDEIRHFGMTESASHIENRDLPFHAVHKSADEMGVHYLARVIAELTRANRETITFQHRRYPHSRFSPKT